MVKNEIDFWKTRHCKLEIQISDIASLEPGIRAVPFGSEMLAKTTVMGWVGPKGVLVLKMEMSNGCYLTGVYSIVDDNGVFFVENIVLQGVDRRVIYENVLVPLLCLSKGEMHAIASWKSGDVVKISVRDGDVHAEEITF